MKTTLNEIRKHSPCTDGWQKLLAYLGKTKSDDEPLSITTILDSNGLDDALWCLRAVKGHDKEIRLFAVWCARQVQHLLKDQRSLDALNVAERYANGRATDDELTASRNAAWAAAWDVARSARIAALAAHAAWAAASNAAMDAARAAAWSAARDVVSVARDVASVVRGAAQQEMRSRQETELRRICEEGGWMRLYCNEHGFIDEQIVLIMQCPYCEIERLTAKLSERDELIKNQQAEIERIAGMCQMSVEAGLMLSERVRLEFLEYQKENARIVEIIRNEYPEDQWADYGV